MSNEEKPRLVWFGPKRLGFGISPVSAEGWAATLIFCALLIGWTRFSGLGQPLVWIGDAILTAIYAVIVFRTYGSS